VGLFVVVLLWFSFLGFWCVFFVFVGVLCTEGWVVWLACGCVVGGRAVVVDVIGVWVLLLVWGFVDGGV